MMTHEEIREFVIKRIIDLRVRKGLSPDALSRALGKNRNYISHIETRINFISIEGLVDICDYFEITIADFMDSKIDLPELRRELIVLSEDMDEHHLKLLNEIAKSFRNTNQK